MTIGERIKKLGFERWYERTLIEGHLYLVTALLGLTLALAGVELVSQHGGARVLLGFVASAIGTVLALFCGHRYLRALVLTQNLSDRATCPRCSAYAAFNVLRSSRAQAEDTQDLASVWLKVKCRKCDNEWTI